MTALETGFTPFSHEPVIVIDRPRPLEGHSGRSARPAASMSRSQAISKFPLESRRRDHHGIHPAAGPGPNPSPLGFQPRDPRWSPAGLPDHLPSWRPSGSTRSEPARGPLVELFKVVAGGCRALGMLWAENRKWARSRCATERRSSASARRSAAGSISPGWSWWLPTRSMVGAPGPTAVPGGLQVFGVCRQGLYEARRGHPSQSAADASGAHFRKRVR
ncbi:MAG: hypothetical protein CM1200mP26_21200 [Acidimicrobiales bacterium]|nr:MAG: hypothetical protein CM1200mP26_21200 [Acidimicrobiales bacterium]